jgi:hypothetical protein
MRRLQAVALAAALASPAAGAGITFTPHFGEYARLGSGQYTEVTLIGTQIEHIYNRDGRKISLGEPFVPVGDSTDAALALIKYLWIGNVFRDSGVPFLDSHPQFCRMIGLVGYQQNTGAIANRARLFGQRPGANGIGDLYGLCGTYTDEYRVGSTQGNGVLSATVKFPVGEYDPNAALNIGTHYWSVVPQFAWHTESFGRLTMDGTLAYQWNGDNDQPAFGGLTPTRIADWWNAEVNFTWKFTEHWFADVGYGYRRSVGRNYYDQVTVNFKTQPLSPQSACDSTNAGLGMLGIPPLLSQSICLNPLLQQFYLAPRPGPYADNGVMGQLATAGIYYIYRTSTVLQARVAMPLRGRGSEIDAVFDVCATADCSAANSVTTTPSRLFGVQEAAAISASPYLELRMVYLFWAP